MQLKLIEELLKQLHLKLRFCFVANIGVFGESLKHTNALILVEDAHRLHLVQFIQEFHRCVLKFHQAGDHYANVFFKVDVELIFYMIFNGNKLSFIRLNDVDW